jgi:hypothetical protein
VDEVSGATGGIASALRQFETREPGLGGVNGIFLRYTAYGSSQQQWIYGALADDPDMELAILRLSGPRLQAAMSGAQVLAAWLDFLNLADAVLRKCPYYSVERLFMDMDRVQKMIEPSMAALATLEPGQVEG